MEPKPPTTQPAEPTNSPAPIADTGAVIQPTGVKPAGVDTPPISPPDKAVVNEPATIIAPAVTPTPNDQVLKALQDTAPADNVAPAFTPSVPVSGAAPGIVTGGGDVVASSGAVPPAGVAAAGAVAGMSGGPSGKRSKKLLFAGIAAVVLLGGGASAYYFGYKVNPSVIYSQSLSNTGKGYDKLIDYVDEQSKASKQSYTGSGAYKFDSTSFSTDGKMSLKGNDKDAAFTADVGVGVTRISGEVRAFSGSGDTPDLYVKASGINGLGDLLGAPADITAKLNTLNDTWIFVDHTLFDNLANASLLTSSVTESKASQPTTEDMLDEARAFGKVNQQYVFSTAKDKAVTKIVKKHGIETVDGHKAYHYTIGFDKTNVKKYITAQRDALKASKLGDWIDKNNYDTVYSGFDEAKKSADNIKSSDTVDIWMDVDQRIVYKVRFADDKNKATNFVDVGLNYKGGDSYPFFISGQGKSDGSTVKAALVTTLNTKSHGVDFKLDVSDDSSDAASLTANFSYKPSATAIKIDKPANAKPLAQVFNELGYGDIYTQLTQPFDASVYEGAANDALLQ